MSAVVAVQGLGEAGSRYAADLLTAACTVRGYDPAVPPALPGRPPAAHRHAARRLGEMRAAGDHAGELGAPEDVVRAAIAWLERLAGEQARQPREPAHGRARAPAGHHASEPGR